MVGRWCHIQCWYWVYLYYCCFRHDVIWQISSMFHLGGQIKGHAYNDLLMYSYIWIVRLLWQLIFCLFFFLFFLAKMENGFKYERETELPSSFSERKVWNYCITQTYKSKSTIFSQLCIESNVHLCPYSTWCLGVSQI